MIINDLYFKKYSPIPLNFNMDELRNYIDVAAKIWLIPVIGEDLYDEIQEQVEEDDISEENQALLTTGGLWQYLCFATVFEALPMLWANISEVGITLGKSDNSDSVTLKDLTLIQQHLRNQTEVLKDQLKKWLCERIDTFPLADCCGCGCGCCDEMVGHLNTPNPNAQLYTPWRKMTDIV